MRLLTALLLAVAAFSLAIGITQPLVRFERLFVFSSTPSLIEIVQELWRASDRALAALVALVSIVLPALKIMTAHMVLAAEGSGPARGRLKTMLSVVSKWSMMDVLLVAIAIFAAKTSGLADAFTQPGIWFYALSVASSAAASFLLR